MKKVAVLLALIAAIGISSANAQSKGGLTPFIGFASTSSGGSTSGFQVGAQYEIMLTDAIGVGPLLTYGLYSNANLLTAGAVGNYHLGGSSRDWDPSIGLFLGYQSLSFSGTASGVPSLSGLAFGGQSDLTYHLSSTLNLHGRISYITGSESTSGTVGGYSYSVSTTVSTFALQIGLTFSF